MKNLLFQNQWANFNQTWHKAFSSKGNHICSNEGPHPFPRGENYDIAKIHWPFKKSSSPESGPISTHLGIEYPWLTGIQVYSNEGPIIFQGEIIMNFENTLMYLKNHLLQNHWVIFNPTLHKASLGVRNSGLFKWRVLPYPKWR